MDKFFEARNVVVVGVSNAPGNLGRLMAANLMEFHFQGNIYLVGPKGGSFLGHKIHARVTDVGDAVDLATILVPAPAVPEVLRQCGEKGIPRVIVQSAGFRELGEERLELEGRVRDLLERYRMRMIGPNCLGVINRRTGLAVPFFPLAANVGAGPVSIISQSGGVGAMMVNLLEAENLGLSRFASVGNKLDVTENDLLEYFARDPETEMILCYLEGIADGRKLMRITRETPKPVIVHKSNTGKCGAAIARSHSASLSSDDRVVDAAFRQSGIIRVREQREAVEVMKAYSLPPLAGNRLAVISRSGGHAVLAADAAEEYGFVLPPYPEDFFQLIREQSRANVISFHNPLDVGDVYNIALYRTLIEKTLEREDIDGMIHVHNYQGNMNVEESRELISSLGELIRKYRKPLASCVFTTRDEFEAIKHAVGFPIFNDPREAARALKQVRDHRSLQTIPLADVRPSDIDPSRARKTLEGLNPGPIPAERLAPLLSAYRIPCVEWEFADSLDSVTSAAHRLGFPVALKTAEPDVVHKSDVGGVRLNLADAERLAEAYGEISRLGPAVLVQKMSGPGLEWLVGGRRDENFGPVVVAGLGGVYVEVFKETGIRVAPIEREEASRLVDECRGSMLMAGLRGDKALDRQALLDVIVRVSWLLHDFPQIRELDLNPVRVYEQGCLALDWRATVE